MIDVEDIQETFYRTPLNINFTDMPTNHVGLPQPACNGCGNCLAGCNTGAKNTLTTNYIQDALNHGAELFPLVRLVLFCFIKIIYIPDAKRRQNNVVATSFQRFDAISTSMQCCSDWDC